MLIFEERYGSLFRILQASYLRFHSPIVCRKITNVPFSSALFLFSQQSSAKFIHHSQILLPNISVDDISISFLY